MTKLRDPLTTEEAFDLVVAVLKKDVAAKVIGRDVGYIRAISTPGNDQRLAVDDAIALDVAYVAAGNIGTPLYDSIGLRIRTAEGMDLAGSAALTGHAVDLTQEHSEALVALLGASTPSPDKLALRKALKELIDGHRAYEKAIRTVRCLLGDGGCDQDTAAPP